MDRNGGEGLILECLIFISIVGRIKKREGGLKIFFLKIIWGY